MSTISIVIPCFNESSVLPILHERINNLVLPAGVKLEVILVDDGSSDDSWCQLRAFAETYPLWKAIRLSRNFGHQSAIWTGLQHCTGEAVMVLDADLQDPPELLERFIEKWRDGFDVVYGVRRTRKESLFKRSAYQMFYRLLNLVSEIRIPPDAGDFCLMDRRVVQEVLSFNPMTGFIRGIRAWVGFRQTAIEYDRDARIAGKPKFGWQKLFALAMDGWFSFSRRPIRMILGTGLTVLVLTGLFLLACGLSWLANGIIPGESVLTIGVLGLVGILGGGNLIAISLIGEYVLRLYESGQGRPAAIISEMVADDSGNGRIDEGLPFRTVDRRSTLSKRKAA